MQIGKHKEAEVLFEQMRKLESYRLEGLDLYSICLWHLKKQVELCYLSNQVLQTNVFAPETWCVVGNCYSLQKEHETALKFLKRAIQLQPEFSMAHTLCGHEYFAIEDFNQAFRSYEKAICTDKRNFKALWGIGSISIKQEKFGRAIHYYDRARQINPFNPTLYTYIGIAYVREGKIDKGLKFFIESENRDPTNSANLFQKVSALNELGRQGEALDILKQLVEKHPKESSIHVELGKLYKSMDQREQALVHFNKALDLNPKDVNYVKNQIERLPANND